MSDNAVQEPPKRRLPFVPDKRPRQPAVVTAVDLDGNTVRVCQATQRGSGPVITRLVTGTLELPPDANRADPVVVGAALARALGRMRIKPALAVMGVPRAQVVLRTLLLPPVANPGELAGIVHFQAGRDLPFRADEAIVDFQVRRTIQVPTPANPAGPAANPSAPAISAPAAGPAGPTTQPRQEVLVAVVRRETVEFHQQLAENAGFKLAALGFLPHAHARCVHACHVADADEAFALVTLRPDEVGFEILSHDALLFSRAITFTPAVAGSEAPDPATAPRPEPLGLVPFAARETVRSLHSFSGSEPDTPITKIVVAGSTGSEGDLSQLLAERLGVPATPLNPGENLRLPEESRPAAAGAIAALGLALGLADKAGLPFDFLNPKRPPVQKDTRRLKILAAATALVFVVVGLAVLRTVLVRRETDRYNQAFAEFKDAEKKRPTYLRTTRQAAVVDEWIRNDRDWTELYAHLSAILPPAEDVYIKSLTVSSQGSFRIAVQARSGEIIGRLDRQLRAAGYDVKPIAITPGSDRFGYDFASIVEVAIPAKLKVDLSKLKTPGRPADDGSLDPNLYRRGGGS